MTLTLANAVLETDTGVKVSYSQPTTGAGNRLRDEAGNEAASFSDESVTNGSRSPRVERAEVDGTALTITFNEALGAAASLANGAFTVKKTPQGGSEEPVSLSGSPAISGATVTLTLANAVLETDTDVKVSYTRPTSGTGNRLRDEAGNEAESFTDQAVSQASQDTTPPTVVRGEIDGGTMTLYFSEALDPNSVGGIFRMSLENPKCESHVQHCWNDFNATGDVEISGNMVTVGLGDGSPRAGAGRWTAMVWYYRSTDPDAGALRDLAGNPVRTPGTRSGGDGEEWRYVYIYLDYVTGLPTVTSVAISSDAGADRTYWPGDKVRVRLTFSEAVTVTGNPRLRIDMDPAAWGRKWVVYESGSGTPSLTFTYEVVEADLSTQGIAVLANTLELDGGTIRSASAAGENAKLVHPGLDHDPYHRVNDAAAALSAATVSGATLRLTFHEILGAAASLANGAFTVKKTPQGGSEQIVGLSGSPAMSRATVALTLANPVLETDTDVKVSYIKPTSGRDNKIKDAAGNEMESFTDHPVRLDETSPTLVRGIVDGGTMTLYFSEPLDEHSVGGAFWFFLDWYNSGYGFRTLGRCGN